AGQNGSPLVNRQVCVFQLQNREVDAGGVDRADVTLLPASIRTGFIHQAVEDFVAVLFPRRAAFAVHHLSVVVVGIVPVAETLVGNVAQILAGVLHQLGNVLVVVLAGIEQAGNGGCRNGGARPAPFGAVLNAAVGQRAVLDVVDRLIDDLPGHRDAGV